jgi:hypothetical protein
MAVKKTTTTSAKKEVLDSYNEVIESKSQEKEEKMNPQEKIALKEKKEAVAKSDSLDLAGIVKDISDLKLKLSGSLTELAEMIESEFVKYQQIKKASEVKEKELEENFEIRKEAATLTALIEIQSQKKEDFEDEMYDLKFQLDSEIKEKRIEWEKEKKAHTDEIKARDEQENIQRKREKEDYVYNFEKDKKLTFDKLDAEKQKLIKEMSEFKEKTEKSFVEREKLIVEREDDYNKLKNLEKNWEKTLLDSVNKAVKNATERLELDSKHREEILLKEIDGERNVLNMNISSLEKVIKDQYEQITKLTAQLEKSYNQVQDIALKAVESSSNYKTVYQSMGQESKRNQGE